MIVGSITTLLYLAQLMLFLVTGGLPFQPRQGPMPGNPALQQGPGTAYHVGVIAASIFCACLGGTVVMGAYKMKTLESIGYARAAAIAAMLPCSVCCLLGLPFGIWALVVLNNPDVQDAFG